MKKRAILLISLLSLFLFLIIPAISAVEVKLSKSIYQSQETLQAEITGNFISLSLENILIYEQDTPRSQPATSDLTKQGNIYYFYAILPNQQGNYSLRIEDARYTDSGVEKTNTIVKEFTLIKTNASSLQINPGFVKTSTDFSIKVKALNSNQEITTVFNQQSQNLSLVEDIQKTISFPISNLNGKYDLKINPYTIPVFIVEKTIINNTLVNQTNQTNFNQTNNNQTTNKTKISIENKTNEEIKSLYCSDFGTECEDNEECNVEIRPALDSGSCCPGLCIEVKESKTGIIIGIILLIVIIIVLVFIYWRSKKRQKPKSADQMLKDKSKQFQDRMQEKGSEVTRNLGKV